MVYWIEDYRQYRGASRKCDMVAVDTCDDETGKATIRLLYKWIDGLFTIAHVCGSCAESVISNAEKK